MTSVDPGSDAIRKSMMTAFSLTGPDHVLDSAVRDGPPYRLIHSAIRNPHSAIAF